VNTPSNSGGFEWAERRGPKRGGSLGGHGPFRDFRFLKCHGDVTFPPTEAGRITGHGGLQRREEEQGDPPNFASPTRDNEGGEVLTRSNGREIAVFVAPDLKVMRWPRETKVQGIPHLNLRRDDGTQLRLHPEGGFRRRRSPLARRNNQFMEVKQDEITEGHTWANAKQERRTSMVVVVLLDRCACRRGRDIGAVGRRTRQSRGLTPQRSLALDDAPVGARPSPRQRNRSS